MARWVCFLSLGVVSLCAVPLACGGEEFGATGGAGGASTSSTAAGGAQATGTGGGQGGGTTGCSGPEDCPGEDTECRKRTCEGGVCGIADTPSGTASANQIAGDCKQKVCDGMGSPMFVDDGSDKPADEGNPCTKGVCTEQGPTHVPESSGTACSGGVCDGTGKCVECLGDGDCTNEVCQENECVPSSCQDGTKNGTETDTDCGGRCAGCGNNHVCVVDGDCLSGFCSGGICKPCSTDADCPAADHCANGTCKDDLIDGQPCAGPGQCNSGFCVDSVCCESACTQGCMACSFAKKGQGANGKCEPVGDGLDFNNDCQASPPESCAQDGTCNGQGACRKWLLGTPCGTVCNNQNPSQLVEKECNGQGACVAQSSQSCEPYVCANEACLTECAKDSDCATGYYCDETSLIPACFPKLTDGDACFEAEQCITNGCCMLPTGPTGPVGFVCSHCCNGVQDFDETGVDCGGLDCGDTVCAGGP